MLCKGHKVVFQTDLITESFVHEFIDLVAQSFDRLSELQREFGLDLAAKIVDLFLVLSRATTQDDAA